MSAVDLLAVIGGDTKLKKVATTDGGEYAGPCPWCGGVDRFRVWPNADKPHWWCRGCDYKGDAAGYVMQRHGVSYQEALRRLGIKSDQKNGHKAGGEGAGILPNKPANVQTDKPAGLTLAQYARAKKLPVDFLRKLGLADMSYMGHPAIRIPYLDTQGTEVAVQFRLALSKDEGTRFKWRTGDNKERQVLYGLWQLEDVRKASYVTIAEGPSDAQTLWLHNEPALGLPSADGWREDRDAPVLDGILKIFIVIEPDTGGGAVRRWLGTSRIRDRVLLVDLGEHKDPSGLYLSDPERFHLNWKAALAKAVPWSDVEQAQAKAAADEAWVACRDLATMADILMEFGRTLERAGVAGEQRSAKLLYLCLVSRLLERPVSAAVKGPSSGGKSFLVARVLDFFSDEAYYALSAMSERALAYSDEPLTHRFLVIFEAAGLQGDFASYLVRSLLSEGRVRYETVEKTRDGLKPRVIEREGPTGLLVTTTAVSLHPENETRLLSMVVADTPEQTRRVLLALAEGPARQVDMTPWHALQRWLQGAEHRVAIPYARTLAEMMPPVAVRLRRDFGAMLNLVRAHAILHQVSRERDAEGQIVASVGDYAAVRELVADLVAEGVEATVPQTVRETVEAVVELPGSSGEGVTVSAIAKALDLDTAASWRRVQAAIRRGYLVNLETKSRRPAKLVLGEALPEETSILPEPERLRVCRFDGLQEGIDTPPSHLQTEEPRKEEAMSWSF